MTPSARAVSLPGLWLCRSNGTILNRSYRVTSAPGSSSIFSRPQGVHRGKNTSHAREFVRDLSVAAAVLAGLTPTYTVAAGNPSSAPTDKILNYNSDMEYRRCGKTKLMVSAVCMGGHWKRLDTVVARMSKDNNWSTIDLENPDFQKNRAEVVSRCIDRGINYIDACTSGEVMAYSRALKGRRDRMYLGFSWAEEEVRNPAWRTAKKLQEAFARGLKQAGLEYVDLWRITCLETSGQHDAATIDELIKALDWAKKTGQARFTGISSHDRPHIKKLIENLSATAGSHLYALHGQNPHRLRRERVVGGDEKARCRLVRHQALRQQLAIPGHQRTR